MGIRHGTGNPLMSYITVCTQSHQSCFSVILNAVICRVVAHKCVQSYTTFHYSDLQANTSTVSFTLANNGTKFAGAEVAQLYLSFPPEAGEPPQQLKGFHKVYLSPGSKQRVSLPLTPRDFSIWSVATHEWKIVSGSFGVAVSSSSRDHRLTGTVRVAV